MNHLILWNKVNDLAISSNKYIQVGYLHEILKYMNTYIYMSSPVPDKCPSRLLIFEVFVGPCRLSY